LVEKLHGLIGIKDDQSILMLLLGEGGTGKSHVINAFMAFAKGWSLQAKVRTTASSGVAASLIGGMTWHSFVKLNMKGGANKASHLSRPIHGVC